MGLRQKPLSPEAKEILDQTTARMLSKTPTRLDAPTPPQGEEVIRQALSDDILRDREGNDARLGAVPDSDSIAALVSQNEDLRDAVKSLTAELTALREEVGKKEEEISEMASSAINVASERWKEIIALRSQLSEAQENYEKLDDVAEDMSDAIVRYLLSDVVDSEIIKQLEGAQDAYVKLPPPDKS
jgi:DNA repair exonuclease SbcCD ATPase subunit